MTERSCIHPFIEQTQKAFEQGGSISDALGRIQVYQNRFDKLVANISPEAKIPHLIGMSAFGLATVVLWEYARAHGVSLPDSKEIVALLPVASVTGNGLTKEEQEWANNLRKQREDNPVLKDFVPGYSPTARDIQDNHRKGAYGLIDIHLENGDITPKEAERQRKDWDKRHGY